jgi:formylglycine-generating enzyme required for sulfatase activity
MSVSWGFAGRRSSKTDTKRRVSAPACVVRFGITFAIRRHEPHANFMEETLSCAYHVFFSFHLSGAELRRQIIGPPSPAAGMTKENPRDSLKYVWIPPGTFDMGCSPGDSECNYDEGPLHRVRIKSGFWLGQSDVTAGAYLRFAESLGRRMAAAPGINGGVNDHLPMVNVSWEDAQAYCGGTGGRLPTGRKVSGGGRCQEPFLGHPAVRSRYFQPRRGKRRRNRFLSNLQSRFEEAVCE